MPAKGNSSTGILGPTFGTFTPSALTKAVCVQSTWQKTVSMVRCLQSERLHQSLVDACSATSTSESCAVEREYTCLSDNIK